MHRRTLALVPDIALLAACASQPATTPVSVAETIARDPQLSTLNGLVQQAGLAETLKGSGPYPVATNGVVHTVDRVLMPPKSH